MDNLFFNTYIAPILSYVIHFTLLLSVLFLILYLLPGGQYVIAFILKVLNEVLRLTLDISRAILFHLINAAVAVFQFFVRLLNKLLRSGILQKIGAFFHQLIRSFFQWIFLLLSRLKR